MHFLILYYVLNLNDIVLEQLLRMESWSTMGEREETSSRLVESRTQWNTE